METKLFFRDEHRIWFFEQGSAIATDTATTAGMNGNELEKTDFSSESNPAVQKTLSSSTQ